MSSRCATKSFLTAGVTSKALTGFGIRKSRATSDPDFRGETFRVLNEKEEKQFGEYRTRRLVLEAYDRLAEDPRFRDQMPTYTSALHISGAITKG
jgi:hypothetical protein